jgi:hypothetical protein
MYTEQHDISLGTTTLTGKTPYPSASENVIDDE